VPVRRRPIWRRRHHGRRRFWPIHRRRRPIVFVRPPPRPERVVLVRVDPDSNENNFWIIRRSFDEVDDEGNGKFVSFSVFDVTIPFFLVYRIYI